MPNTPETPESDNQRGSAPAMQHSITPLTVSLQYVKDMSLEVPHSPEIFSSLQHQPEVHIDLDVTARRLHKGQEVFEVTLKLLAKATEPGAIGGTEARVAFIAELSYAGVFNVSGIPDESREGVLLVQCPHLLFPYARNVLGDMTRDGGFPPVLLQPVDFVALWQTRRAPPASQLN